jgi:hypothetical protein
MVATNQRRVIFFPLLRPNMRSTIIGKSVNTMMIAIASAFFHVWTGGGGCAASSMPPPFLM